MAGVGLPASVWSGAAEHTAMCPRHGLISLALAPPLSSPEGDSAVSAIVLISVSHNSTNVVSRNWEKYYLKHETCWDSKFIVTGIIGVL